jgi:tetratricopeptide (TPR) repeat protein
VADDLRTLTATLARDPTSLVYAELAQALRRRGQNDEALRVVLHGLARHPHHAEGHDALARIYADLGDMDRAGLAWGRVLDIAPETPGALKGVAFVRFRQKDATAAAALLEQALALDPSDEEARRALETVRRVAHEDGAATGEAPAPAAAAQEEEAAAGAPRPRPAVFRGFDRATADILLLDERGLVLAGGLAGPDGGDVSEVAAAALAGVSGEATRTGEYLGLGAWRSIVAEAETANLVMAPVGEGALLLVRRDRSMPVGLALRFAERARGTALAWLEGQGA